MKLNKERKSRLIDDLIQVALDILHHDIDINDDAGKWEIERLQEEFGVILDGME
jgi:hypothetical protein